MRILADSNWIAYYYQECFCSCYGHIEALNTWQKRKDNVNTLRHWQTTLPTKPHIHEEETDSAWDEERNLTMQSRETKEFENRLFLARNHRKRKAEFQDRNREGLKGAAARSGLLCF